MEKYIASADFRSKASGTQRHYRTSLDQLKEICGRALIGDLLEKHIREIRKRFTATSKADLAVMMLRMLWSFAKENLAMDLGVNPASEIKTLHRRSWSHEPWPNWVIEKFEAEARPKPNAPLALLLLLYTGQRASDVVKMRWEQYDGGGIGVRQQKTGTLLWIPCHSRLKEMLDCAERRSEFILTTQYGHGYSAPGLCSMVAEATARIGAKERTAHGLRCNAAVALAEAGCSVHQIMAITGHKTWKEAMRYTQQAQQKRLAQQAIDALEVANPRTAGVRTSG
jgi:integrase